MSSSADEAEMTTCFEDEYDIPASAGKDPSATHQKPPVGCKLRVCIGETPVVDDKNTPSRPCSSNSVHGFQVATMQWRGRGQPKRFYRLESYDYLGFYEDGQMTHTGGEMCCDLESVWPVRMLVRTENELFLKDNESGMVQADIWCNVHIEKGVPEPLPRLPGVHRLLPKPRRPIPTTSENPIPLPTYPTRRFLVQLQGLDKIYIHLRSAANLKQTFLLQIHHAQLNQFAGFLETFEYDSFHQMRILDPSQYKLRRWSLERITAYSLLYKRLTNVGQGLVATNESLLDVVTASSGDKNTPDLELLAAELRGSGHDVTNRLSRMSDNLDHHLQLLSLSRDMSQMEGIHVLTVLATVFLPLSLSAGVLSMQTRFKDLGDLVYDFFGVVVLLLAVVLVIIAVMLAVSRVREWMSKPSVLDGKKLKLLVMRVALILGALIFASFVVGMFKDVMLGVKILGYGMAAAIIGLPTVFVLVFYSLACVHS